MTTEQDDTILSVVSNIFLDKNINSESICNYIDFVCGKYNFECGFVYEIDQRNTFHLKEHRYYGNIQWHESFSIDIMNANMLARLSIEEPMYIVKKNCDDVNELQMLDFFYAQYLVIASIVDENLRTHGFVVFANYSYDNVVDSKNIQMVKFLVSILENYVGIRMYQNKFIFAKNSLESILDNAGIDIYVNDFYTHEILYANKSMAAPYGGKDKFMKSKCWEVLFPDQHGPCEFCPQKKIIDDEGNPTKVYSWNYQRPFDGAWFRVFSAAFRWVDGRLAHVVSSADITENKRNEALIHYMANYDALTGLPNRRMLVSECERRITHARKGEKPSLLFFDIDGFKAVNDTLGHDAGDELLVQLGGFFSSIPMLKDAIYRNGGDEFVALVGDGVGKGHIRNLANFMQERFREPWKLKNGPAFCGISIGVACYPEDGVVAEELINKADQAMYYIKKTGGADICFYQELP